MEKLIKISENLDTFAKVCYRVCNIFAWILAVVAIILPFAGDDFFADGTNSITMGSFVLELTPGEALSASVIKMRAVIGFAVCVAVLIFACMVIRLIRKILLPMTQGQPFDISIAQNLRKLSWITLYSGIAYQIAAFAGNLLLYSAYDIDKLFNSTHVASLSVDFKLDCTFIAVFGLILLLSYIFQYGTQLQELSDETL